MFEIICTKYRFGVELNEINLGIIPSTESNPKAISSKTPFLSGNLILVTVAPKVITCTECRIFLNIDTRDAVDENREEYLAFYFC